MKRLVIVGFLMVISLFAKAQIASQGKPANYLISHLSIGGGFGTSGLEVGAAAMLSNNIQLRAGINLMPQIKFSYEADMSSRSLGFKDVDLEAKLNMFDFHALCDYYPSKYSSFHFSVGVYVGSPNIVDAYNINRKEELKEVAAANNLLPDDKKVGVKLGDYLLKPDANGEVNASLNVHTIKPYVGFGIGRAVPKTKRFSFQFEMGCQLWGKPSISCNGEDLGTKEVDESTREVLDYISKVTFLPVLKFRLNGRIF